MINQNKLSIHSFPSETVKTQSAALIADYLVTNLQASKKLLLLLSGGSAIGMYQELFQILLDKQVNLENLTVSLFDERFVPKGSIDSNEQQLREAGIINLIVHSKGTWIPYLSEEELDPHNVATHVATQFQTVLSINHQLVILAGMGEDGHTAGLLPVKETSPNKNKLYETDQLVVYYDVDPQDSDNPFHHRLTCTPILIQKAEQVFMYVTGEKKSTVLQKLLHETSDVYLFPSQTLLDTKKLTLVTDIGVK